jgi:hypothetical protein
VRCQQCDRESGNRKQQEMAAAPAAATKLHCRTDAKAAIKGGANAMHQMRATVALGAALASICGQRGGHQWLPRTWLPPAAATEVAATSGRQPVTRVLLIDSMILILSFEI